MAKSRPMSTVRHISFATRNFTRAARQLSSTAKRFDINTYFYTVDHPAIAALRQKHPKITSQARGAGYWLWKPAIILDALERSEEGTIVLYTDAAMHMIADPAPLLLHAMDHEVMLFEHRHETYRQSDWTKRDCFILTGADTPEHWNTRQCWAGVQVYRNSPRARDFVRELLDACSDERTITDLPNTLGFPNLPGYVGHRHDQSLLTIVGRKHNVPHFRDPTQWGQMPSSPDLSDDVQRPLPNFSQTFYLHRKQDHAPLTKLMTLTGIKKVPWETAASYLSWPTHTD